MGYILLAEMSARRGDLEGAVGYYYQIAKEVKRDELFEKAVQYAIAMRSADYLVEVGRAWTQTMPKSSKAAWYWFTITLRTQQIERSYDALRLALDKSDIGTRQALLRELPRWYSDTPPTAATLKAVERVLAPHMAAPSTAVSATAALAQLGIAASDTPSALALFQNAAALDARHPETVALAGALLPLNPATLKPWLLAQIEQTGDNAPLLTLVRWQAENEGAYATLRTLQDAWRKSPNHPGVGLLLARYQIDALRWGQAKTTLERALQLVATPQKAAPEVSPTTVQEIRLLLAEVELMKTPPGPIDDWLEEISDESFDGEVLRLRLMDAVGKGDISLAEQLLAAAPTPQEAKTWNKDDIWERVLRAKGRYTEALTALDKRLLAQPDSKALLMSRGMLFEEMGNTSAALEQFRQLLKRFPNDPLVQNALGYTLADHNLELASAKDLLTQANAGNPNSAMVMDSLGWVEFRLGNLAQALHWLTLAHAREPHPEIAMHLGEVMWAMGNKERATELFKEALDTIAPYAPLVKTLKRLGVALP